MSDGSDHEPETEEVARVVLVDVMIAAVALAAARFDKTVSGEAFLELMTKFEAEVRADERADCENELAARNEQSARAPVALDRAPQHKLKLMQPDDAKEIKRLVEQAERTPSGKLPQGTAERIGAQLGYTKSQVQSVIYDRGR